MNIHAGRGVAVREYPLKWQEGTETKSGSADYLLYADGWAVGVVEAKPAGGTPRPRQRAVAALRGAGRPQGSSHLRSGAHVLRSEFDWESGAPAGSSE